MFEFIIRIPVLGYHFEVQLVVPSRTGKHRMLNTIKGLEAQLLRYL